eukprot:CAMPEP_0202705340 /NCGR_PEP_ID=MMETSP1385-20130828/17902_1 /ASSEMBLY_ACC=CAM_ASM_000861 /TAXON_ID=933848 /ORGANISM="Elphidium margaritaceum" /LENGTH=242 /DNA_ID=CAMNT_0049363551 /DNA_START=31 /DNA_END=756 /DNA_ORIENTATION=+
MSRFQPRKKSMVPPSQMQSAAATMTTTTGGADIIQDVLRFGEFFAPPQKQDEYEQILSDEELAEIYEQGDENALNQDILTKIYHLRANHFQMEEYLVYVERITELTQTFQERPCLDPNCTWHKDVYRNQLYSLAPQQIVHVMFYHCHDYNEIARSQVRAERFMQDVWSTDTPGQATAGGGGGAYTKGHGGQTPLGTAGVADDTQYDDVLAQATVSRRKTGHPTGAVDDYKTADDIDDEEEHK